MSRSKQIGTSAENHVVDYIATRGFAGAERRALFGVNDRGDITGTPGICWQVKGGKMAETASDNRIREWMDELDAQIANSGSDFGVLIRKRSGYGAKRVGQWYAHMRMGTMYDLMHRSSALSKGEDGKCPADKSAVLGDEVVTMSTEAAVVLLSHAGYR